jgi:hypothetical protein
MTEKQTEKAEKPKRVYTKKAPSRGGARVGGGRPKGSTNKVDIKDLAEDFKSQSGMTFQQFVNSQMMKAAQDGEHDRLQRYILGLSKYFIQEQTQKIDVTTAGESVKGAFTFIPVEMKEWSQK